MPYLQICVFLSSVCDYVCIRGQPEWHVILCLPYAQYLIHNWRSSRLFIRTAHEERDWEFGKSATDGLRGWSRRFQHKSPTQCFLEALLLLMQFLNTPQTLATILRYSRLSLNIYYNAATRLSMIHHLGIDTSGKNLVAWIMEHQGRGGGKNTEAVGWGAVMSSASYWIWHWDHICELRATAVTAHKLHKIKTAKFQHEWTFPDPHLWLVLAADICLGIISFHGYDHWSHVPVDGSRPENTQVVLSRLDYPKQTKRWKVVGSGGGALLEECWELESVSGGRCRISLHTWRGINKSTV